MAKQKRHDKPGFKPQGKNAVKPPGGREVKKAANPNKKKAKGKGKLPEGAPMGVSAPCVRRCGTCISCTIFKGNQENEARINATYWHR